MKDLDIYMDVIDSVGEDLSKAGTTPSEMETF